MTIIQKTKQINVTSLNRCSVYFLPCSTVTELSKLSFMKVLLLYIERGVLHADYILSIGAIFLLL